MAVGPRGNLQALWTDKKPNPEPLNSEPVNAYLMGDSLDYIISNILFIPSKMLKSQRPFPALFVVITNERDKNL